MSPFRKIFPPSVGSACSVCYGTGRAFGNITTPDSIVCKVSGIQKGDAWAEPFGEPANGTYKLLQVSPCTFTFASGLVVFAWRWIDGVTEVLLVFGASPHFVKDDTTVCAKIVDNGLTDPAGEFFGGVADLQF